MGTDRLSRLALDQLARADTRVETGPQSYGVAHYISGKRVGRLATISTRIMGQSEVAQLFARSPALYGAAKAVMAMLDHNGPHQAPAAETLRAVVAEIERGPQ